MCDPFDVTFSGSADKLVENAKLQISVQGGTLTGDTTAGNINISLPIVGVIEGNYKINGQVITITITQKPQFVPCGMIQSKIEDVLKS
ncbi:MAG TPA: hypothetical protein VNZ45_17060 [Bacteroidia bacterium]|jgi:hypothetical protein|nr:hypothetical protein [Bacteroidia bacterium]